MRLLNQFSDGSRRQKWWAGHITVKDISAAHTVKLLLVLAKQFENLNFVKYIIAHELACRTL